jgi:hypothetical protein
MKSHNVEKWPSNRLIFSALFEINQKQRGCSLEIERERDLESGSETRRLKV